MNVILSDGVTTYLQLYLFTCYRYKSVVLASSHFGRDFTGQIVTAEQVSPVKVQLHLKNKILYFEDGLLMYQGSSALQHDLSKR